MVTTHDFKDIDAVEDANEQVQEIGEGLAQSLEAAQKEIERLNALLADRKDLTPEEAEALAEDPDVARIAQILSTGVATAQVNQIMAMIPPDRHGCLIRETDGDIFKFKNLGYRIETTDTLPGAKGLHGAGDSRIRIGDLILVTTSIKNKEAIQRVERELIMAKLKQGETEYEGSSASHGIPTFNEGKTEIRTGLPQ